MDYKYKFEKYKNKYNELLEKKQNEESDSFYDGGMQVLKNTAIGTVGWATDSEVNKIPTPVTGKESKISFFFYNDKTRKKVFGDIKKNRVKNVNSDHLYKIVTGEMSYSGTAAVFTSTDNWYIVPKGVYSKAGNSQSQHMFTYVRIPEKMIIGKDSKFNMWDRAHFFESEIRQLFYEIKTDDRGNKMPVSYRNGWTFYGNVGPMLLNLKNKRGEKVFPYLKEGDKVVGIITQDEKDRDANINGKISVYWNNVINKRSKKTLGGLMFTPQMAGLFPIYYRYKGQAIYSEVNYYENASNRWNKIWSRVGENWNDFWKKNIKEGKPGIIRDNGEILMVDLKVQKDKVGNVLKTDTNYNWVKTLTDLDLCSGCIGFKAKLVSNNGKKMKNPVDIYGVLGTRITPKKKQLGQTIERLDELNVVTQKQKLIKKCLNATPKERIKLRCAELLSDEDMIYQKSVEKNIGKTKAKKEMLREKQGLKPRRPEIIKELEKNNPKLFSKYQDQINNTPKFEKIVNEDASSTMHFKYATIVDQSTASIYNIKEGEYHTDRKETCKNLKNKYKTMYLVNKISGIICDSKDIRDCNDDLKIFVSKLHSSNQTASSSSSSEESENAQIAKNIIDDLYKGVDPGEVRRKYNLDTMGLPLNKPSL